MLNRTQTLGLAALGASLAAAVPVWAQEATAEATAVVTEAAAPIIDKGDVAWMMTASALVLFMTIPGLALFYGGLVRTKNMLSVLMQVTMIAAIETIMKTCISTLSMFLVRTRPP